MIEVMNENETTTQIISMINDINSSDKKNKISAITNLLSKIETGYILGLSRDGKSINLNLERTGSGWIDPEGGYKYSTHDIADEIVNGRYRTAMKLIDKSTLKPATKMSKRNAPTIWR